MPEKTKSRFSVLMDRLDKTVNFVCVVFLFIQVVSIIVMVVGRYWFNYVPRGTEQLALFSMVWFSLLSISLSIRNDAHIKMEIMDVLVARDKLVYFQYLSALVTLVFSVCMIVYGVNLVKMTAGTRLSGVRISEGWLYLSLPVSGVCMAIASAALVIEKAMGGKHVD